HFGEPWYDFDMPVVIRGVDHLDRGRMDHVVVWRPIEYFFVLFLFRAFVEIFFNATFPPPIRVL
ncbi:MAG: hypothetical protein ACE14V_15690, partial [bacterium]